MRAWYFSENGYPYLPDKSEYDSVRVSVPSRLADPRLVADLYDRYLDEFVAAEAAGFGLMINEHHQTATNLNPSLGLLAAVLARRTSTARILVLGHQLAFRRDPLRVAEEMAVVDNYSRGRLEVGFVRGVAPDIAPANAHPLDTVERLWEAHDLIVRAWTSLDGPFNWESEHYHYRQVNLWPRPYQQPHPPLWVTTSSTYNTPEIARHGYVCATFLSGYTLAGRVFHAYRETAAEEGLAIGPDRLAYACMGFAADSDEAAREGAERMMWFTRQTRTAPQWGRVPGYMPTNELVQLLRGGNRREGAEARGGGIDGLIENGILFCGTPDTICRQVEEHFKRTGGYGHLIVMGQNGTSGHEETLRSIELWGAEVLPRIAALGSAFAD
ncbi:MAG TPA: LLM class flavin-dependent oxidoreductase [Acidimicrobiales bacterium]|nr:LLM class flavin-dependent oxidoreductase [Acidimicrobiales bacterium]